MNKFVQGFSIVEFLAATVIATVSAFSFVGLRPLNGFIKYILLFN